MKAGKEFSDKERVIHAPPAHATQKNEVLKGLGERYVEKTPAEKMADFVKKYGFYGSWPIG